MTRKATWQSRWIAVWVVPAAILALHSAISGTTSALTTFVVPMVAACAIGLVAGAWLPRRLVAWILAGGLAALALAGLAERSLSAHVWVTPERFGLPAVVDALRSDRVSTFGYRSWALPAGSDRIEASFEARRTAGTYDWDWFRSAEDIVVEPAVSDDGAYTRLAIPTGDDPYVMRTYDLAAPAAGETFRVELEARADAPIPAQGCRGVWLQVWGRGGDRSCKALELDTEWRAFSHEWTVPSEAASSVIRIVLNDFDGLALDVRDVRLLQRSGGAGTWNALEPVMPGGAFMYLSWPGRTIEHQSGYMFAPESDWIQYSYATQSDDLKRADHVRATIVAGSGHNPDFVLETRNVEIRANGRTRLEPLPPDTRKGLLTEQPNLGGHSVVVVALAVGLYAMGTWRAALVLIVAGSAVWLTESRAAWSILGLAALGILTHSAWRAGRAWLVAWALVIAVILGLMLGPDWPGASRLLGAPVDNPTTRINIWSTAWHAFLQNPVLGLDGASSTFPEFWVSSGASGSVASHAHSFIFEFAARFGSFGLVSAVLLWLLLLAFAWDHGRPKAILFVGCVFALQALDFTMFYAGVLYPFVLGLALTRNVRENVSLSSSDASSVATHEG